ncbi:MAG: hypothetical protein ACTS8P_06455, partial [Arsenophonus sp. NC-XBC3-MAG3]
KEAGYNRVFIALHGRGGEPLYICHLILFLLHSLLSFSHKTIFTLFFLIISTAIKTFYFSQII